MRVYLNTGAETWKPGVTDPLTPETFLKAIEGTFDYKLLNDKDDQLLLILGWKK